MGQLTSDGQIFSVTKLASLLWLASFLVTKRASLLRMANFLVTKRASLLWMSIVGEREPMLVETLLRRVF